METDRPVLTSCMRLFALLHLCSTPASSQLVLEAPLLLTWSSQQLRTRLSTMESLLGLSSHSLATLLQQHPQLLPASSHLRHTLQLVQQLFVLAATSEQAGFGTGVVSSLLLDPGSQRHGPPGDLDPKQQAVAAAARRFVLQHPQVLLVEPESMQAHVAAMQATSGLPAAQVAAMLISQPALLLNGDGDGGRSGRGQHPKARWRQGRRRAMDS